MRLKDLAKTKTFWSGIGLILYGAYQITEGNSEEGIQSILNGLAFVFLRQAVGKAINNH